MLEILFLGLLAARCFAGSTQSFLTDQHDNNCGDSLFHTHSGQCDQTILTLETLKDVPSPPLEVHPLIVSGPSHNRVDLVFFSDGYLLEEKNKFIQDALRLAQDISANQTFATVNPLLNFWAAFSPSNEVGYAPVFEF
ncbi:hypothetical protein H0H92_002511 [Tricholoma furcatifolium]|nr:hypothetical protein H0H92_002511 [Tricholoma furcatifolium]